MKKPKLRELAEAIRAVWKGPYTVAFPKRPTTIFERFRGRPKFSSTDCIGCAACAQVCPANAIEVLDRVEGTSGTRTLTTHLDNCIFCGQCEEYCTTSTGVHLSQEYDLATFDRSTAVETIQKDLLICESCGAVIGPIDQVRWVANKIGHAAFSNPTLMLIALQEIDVSAYEPRGEEEPASRADRIRILCPRCRRETTLKP